MTDVAGFIRKAAEQTGFLRENYNDDRLPTDPNRVTIFSFFGDLRSMFVLSSLLLKRFKEEERGSRYFIVASWPGFSGLFPFVDEYWGLADLEIAKKMFLEASQFRNKSSLVANYYRSLNQYFFEDLVLAHEQLSDYYGLGIQDKFWAKYKKIVRYLPPIPSTATLGKEFNRELASRGGFKVFLFPSTHLQTWRLGDIHVTPVSRDFWLALVKKLLVERFVPVVYKSFMTYDLSTDLTGRCIFVDDSDISKTMAMMRATGCVLDLFTGVSKIAMAARCPFVMVNERQRYAALKEYELDDLCGAGVPKRYIFSFPTIIESGTIETWDDNILQSIVAKLNAFLPALDRDTWPSTGESFEQVPYENIRKLKMKKFGTRLLKVPNDD